MAYQIVGGGGIVKRPLSKNKQKLPQQLAAHVAVNQGFSPPGVHQVIAGAQVTGHPAVAASDVAHYGASDPWFKNLIAMQHAYGPQGTQTTNDATNARNAWVQALRDSIDAQINQARTSTSAANKSILRDFGDVGLAKSSGLFSDAELASISADPTNPLTWSGRENYLYGHQQMNLNENAGRANVFYGGARAYGLGALGMSHLGRFNAELYNRQKEIDANNALLAANIAAWNRQFIEQTQPAQG